MAALGLKMENWPKLLCFWPDSDVMVVMVPQCVPVSTVDMGTILALATDQQPIFANIPSAGYSFHIV